MAGNGFVWPQCLDLARARAIGLVLSAICPLCFGLLGLWAGKDGGWDLLNYHWYNPYAFLNNRMGFDLAVGHHATYYNPLLDLPLYLAAGAHVPAAVTGFLLSCTQGLNFPLLFWLGWALFSPLTAGQRLAASAATALAGMCGAGALMEVAAVFYDNIISLGVFAACLILVSRQQTLITGQGRIAGGWVLLAGILAGATAGLKLTTATYALGLGGALLLVPASLPRRLLLVSSFAVGGLTGLALGGGFWMQRLWEFGGSPFFPYFNDLLHSPLLADASYKDERFIPHDLLTKLLFPFVFSFNSLRVAEWQFRDVRILTAFVLLLGGAGWLILRTVMGRPQPPRATPWIDPAAGRFLVVAAAIGYGAWLWMFCIYRYLLPVEMIAPLLMAVALGWMPLTNGTRMAVLLTLLVLSQALVQVSFAQRYPWGDRYLEVQPPAIAADEQAMILMTGREPMAYVIPFFSPQVPFIRIDGYLVGPYGPDTGLTTLMRRRVREHPGRRYVLFSPGERGDATGALAAYGLVIKEATCRAVTSTVNIPLDLCRVAEAGVP
jgi:hypothetical protein